MSHQKQWPYFLTKYSTITVCRLLLSSANGDDHHRLHRVRADGGVAMRRVLQDPPEGPQLPPLAHRPPLPRRRLRHHG